MEKVRHLSQGVPATFAERDVVSLRAWCGELVPYNPPTSQRFITDNPKACTCEECLSEHGLYLLEQLG